MNDTSMIKLRNGMYAIVDKDDYEELSKYRWFVNSSGYPARVVRKGSKKSAQTMHRFIMHEHKDAPVIDHINGNVLDNRKSNLRPASIKENSRNKRKSVNKASEYKGVVYDGSLPRNWKARITVDGELIYLGSFETEEDAAYAYNIAATNHFGEFARLNDVLENKINKGAVMKEMMRKRRSPKKQARPGMRYGMYTIVRLIERQKNGQSYWLCRCDCGVEKRVRLSSLTAGLVVSCGCYRKSIGQSHASKSRKVGG